MSFYRNTIRKARNQHKCEICHAKIEVGEKYHDKAGLDENGEIWYLKECEKCQPVIQEFLDHDSDYGYNEDFIREWWREEKCPKCTEYWNTGGGCDFDMTHYCRCEKFEEDKEDGRM